MNGLLTIPTLAAGVTALVGLYVAVLAFRGYRAHQSTTMAALGIGIVAITVIPFLITHALAPVLALSDAKSILGVMIAQTLGLLAIYLSFR